jgi:endonuclease YncB( thermonuclease family)
LPLRRGRCVRKLSCALRRFLSLACVLALAGAVSAAAPATRPVRSGVVTRVLAGDTLQVRVSGGKQVRVRLLGIRAPAPGSCFDGESRAELRVLTAGKRVRVDGGGPRAYVALAGGADLGRELIARGYAQIDAWGPAFSRLAAYVPVQLAAQAASRGMWGACAADLSVDLAAAPAAVEAKGPVTYTATVTNEGLLGVRGVELDVRPPASARLMSAASADGSCTASGWVALCSFAALPDGGTATATVVVQAGASGTIATRAHVRFAACATAACGSTPLQDTVPDNNETASLVPIGVPAAGGAEPSAGCDTYHYPGVCIPKPPPFLHCADIPYRAFYVPRGIPDPDPHGFDGDQDGVGCTRDDY